MKKKPKDSFGKLFKLARLKAGFTQEYVSRKTKKKQSYISGIETGARKNPNLDTLISLANAIGWSIEDILTLKG